MWQPQKRTAGEGGRRETKESVELPARTRDGDSAAAAQSSGSGRAGAAVASALPTAALAQEILSALPKHLSQVGAKNRQSKIAVAEGKQRKRERREREGEGRAGRQTKRKKRPSEFLKYKFKWQIDK